MLYARAAQKTPISRVSRTGRTKAISTSSAPQLGTGLSLRRGISNFVFIWRHIDRGNSTSVRIGSLGSKFSHSCRQLLEGLQHSKRGTNSADFFAKLLNLMDIKVAEERSGSIQVVDL